TLLQDTGGELLAHLVGAEVVEAQLHQTASGVDARLGEVSRLWLVQLGGLDRAERDLERAVAVVLVGLDLHHPARRHPYEGDRNGTVLVVPDLCHADLLADDRPACHRSALSAFTRTLRTGMGPAERVGLCPGVPVEPRPTAKDVEVGWSQIKRSGTEVKYSPTAAQGRIDTAAQGLDDHCCARPSNPTPFGGRQPDEPDRQAPKAPRRRSEQEKARR